MCILITTTAHPDYPFIALSNRDEFFARPTQPATVRELRNGVQIISPLDLGRVEHGTWIGATSEGRVAMLLNYRENKEVTSKVSRGILPIEYLSSTLEDEQWYDSLHDNLTASLSTGEPVNLGDIGGFSLVYGKLATDAKLGRLHPLNIMSNRGERGKIHSWATGGPDAQGDISEKLHFSVSNALYYEPWPKTEMATSRLQDLVDTAVEKAYTQSQLVEECFKLLSIDTYNKTIRDKKDMFSQAKLIELRNSIFIPPLDTADYSGPTKAQTAKGRYYGTRTQTLILYDRNGRLHYYERDLYDGDTEIQHVRTQHFQVDVERSVE